MSDVAMDDGTVLPVYELGLASGPPILFAHGCGYTAGSYLPLLDRLGRSCRVFAFDARGHGGARQGRCGHPNGLERFTRDLNRTLAQLAASTGPVHVVGHSFGAAIALRLAAEENRWMSSLTLFEPSLLPTANMLGRSRAELQLTRMIAGVELCERPNESPGQLARRLAARPPFSSFTAEDRLRHARAVLRPVGRGGYERCCPAAVEAATLRLLLLEPEWPDLSRVHLPVVVVAGDTTLARRLWMADLMPDLVAELPSAVLEVFEGTGHLMLLERPERACAAVEGNIARATRSASFEELGLATSPTRRSLPRSRDAVSKRRDQGMIRNDCRT